jgi:hypothetical protein
MAIQHLKPGSLAKFGHVDWFTPTHRLYTVGKDGRGGFFAGRMKKPAFLIFGNTQAEVELEAGKLINASLE